MLLRYLTALLVMLWMSPILAQTSEIPPDYTDQTEEAPRERPDAENNAELGRYLGLTGIGPSVPASPPATQMIVAALSDARESCAETSQKAYMIDCLAYELAVISREMPNSGDYHEASLAIKVAAEKLRVLAKENADPVLKPARFKRAGKGRTSTRRRLTPIDSSRSSEIGEQAAAIIAEAETVLLRSASNSDERRVHYEQISAALGSNKLLLRSL